MKKVSSVLLFLFFLFNICIYGQGWMTNNISWTQNASGWRSNVSPVAGYDNTLTLEGTTLCGAPTCRWASTSPSGWCIYDFGVDRVLTGFRIFNDYQLSQQPKNCLLQYSNSFSGPWTTISSKTCGSSGWQWEYFPDFAPTTARFWKLEIVDSYGSRFQICEVGFFEACSSPGLLPAANNSPVCIDSLLSLSTILIPGASYSWAGPNGFSSNMQNPVVSSASTSSMNGVYRVEATINGCIIDTGSTYVIVNAAGVTPIISGNVVLLPGQSTSISVLNPCNNCTYTWSNGMTGLSIVVDSVGSYFVIASTSCGISTPSNILTVVSQSSVTSTNIPIAAGGFHSVSICNNSSVQGWGKNQYGQTGDGINNYIDEIPDSVIGLSNIISLYAGERHTLALKTDSTVCAWGGNQAGQIGDGTATQRNTPVDVIGLGEVVFIDGGYQHSLAIKADSTIWSWGDNYWGQLGDGTITNRVAPIQILSLSGIIAAAGGNGHSLALKGDGTVWAWGENNQGQLGDSTFLDRHSPVQVHGLDHVIAVSCGYEHSIALRSDSTVWTWGINTGHIVPTQLPNFTSITAITGGGYFSLAIRSDSTVWGWGDNGYGELGDGTYTSRIAPVQMSNLSQITNISAGHGHSLALKRDGTLWACGYNYFGQLGDGTNLFFDATIANQVVGLCQVSLPCIGSSATITPIGSTTICQGDSVILVSSYAANYLWSNGETSPSISTSTAGSYFVTVSDTSGCTSTSDSIFISINPLPNTVITSDGPTTFCSGDSVILSADTTSSCIWNNGAVTQNITILSSGNYFVTLTNVNGCSATSSSIDVVVNALPSATITLSGPTTFCQGDSITLISSIANFYSWSDGSTTQSIIVSASGNYLVNIIDSNGCSNTSASLGIIVNSLPSSPIINSNGDTLISSASVGNQWFLDNNLIIGAVTPSYLATQIGNYFVVVTDVNGCTASSDSIYLASVDIPKLDLNNSIIIIPNPNNGRFIIVSNDIQFTRVLIMNIYGIVVYNSESNFSEIDLTDQAKGVYFLKANFGNKSTCKKIVVE